MATILRNFAAYAAALAGFTAVIIASDELGVDSGPSAQVFMLAVIRATEIVIGIVCAGLVLAGTDLGDARAGLPPSLQAFRPTSQVRFTAALALPGTDQAKTRAVRRDLIRRVIALESRHRHSDRRSLGPTLSFGDFYKRRSAVFSPLCSPGVASRFTSKRCRPTRACGRRRSYGESSLRNWRQCKPEACRQAGSPSRRGYGRLVRRQREV